MQNAEKRERIEEKKYNKKLQNKIKKKVETGLLIYSIFFYIKKQFFFVFLFVLLTKIN
jgi:hypothetical protein